MSSIRKNIKGDLSKRQHSSISSLSQAPAEKEKLISARSKTPSVARPSGFAVRKLSLSGFLFAKAKASAALVGYMLVSLALGLVILLSIATASLLLHIREEASEDYVRPQCGPDVTTHSLSTIGFGSCNKHDFPQTFWPKVSEILRQESLLTERHIPAAASESHNKRCQRTPLRSLREGIDRPADAFVWLGDVVYLDGSAGWGTNVTIATEIAYSAMDVPIKGYEGRTNPDYKAFKSQLRIDNPSAKDGLNLIGEEHRANPASRIIGTWDDHDMGINDGGKEFKFHRHTQGRFLDFLEVPAEDSLRKRDGTYSFHAISAPSGSVDGFSLSEMYENAFCIILIDVRTHRDAINLWRDGDMLGAEQWTWLEEVLKNHVSDAAGSQKKKKCAATIIGSGIQFLSSEKPTEQWWNFKENQVRLWKLLQKYQVSRTALISGDIHLMELVKADSAYTGLGYPVVEFTSSGLTHHSGKFFDVFTSFRWLLAKIFPMAVACTSRGVTPVGDEVSRKCSSAFSLLPDWLYETIFPAFDWRLGHYLGRNVGAISLQVSVASNSAPQLALRFAGHALSLEERDDFVPYRYENEPRVATVAENNIISANSVTRHDATLQVLEYVQPLADLEFQKNAEFNPHSRHTFMKFILFVCQNLAVSMSNNRYNRNIGIIVGLAIFITPIGMAVLWVASRVVRHCRGAGKRKSTKQLVKAK